MADYDLMCPLGYGAIRFVGGVTAPRGVHCPVSGANQCLTCEVEERNEANAKQRVKKEGERR